MRRIANGLDNVYYSIGELSKPKFLGELISFNIEDNIQTIEIDCFTDTKTIIAKTVYDVTIEIPEISKENRIDFLGSSLNSDGSLRLLTDLKRKPINFYIVQNFTDGKDYITLWNFVVLGCNIEGSTKNESVNFSTVKLTLRNTMNDCIDIKSLNLEDTNVPLFNEDESFYLKHADNNPTFRKERTV